MDVGFILLSIRDRRQLANPSLAVRHATIVCTEAELLHDETLEPQNAMLDHISIPVDDLEASASFYDPVLATLGYGRIKQRDGAIGYGPPTRRAPVFWIHSGPEQGGAHAGVGLHISLMADSRAMVDAFHAEALRQGGVDAGAPGPRPQYTQPFYGAFALDPDGFKIEAVYRGDH